MVVAAKFAKLDRKGDDEDVPKGKCAVDVVKEMRVADDEKKKWEFEKAAANERKRSVGQQADEDRPLESLEYPFNDGDVHAGDSVEAASEIDEDQLEDVKVKDITTMGLAAGGKLSKC